MHVAISLRNDINMLTQYKYVDILIMTKEKNDPIGGGVPVRLPPSGIIGGQYETVHTLYWFK